MLISGCVKTYVHIPAESGNVKRISEIESMIHDLVFVHV